MIGGSNKTQKTCPPTRIKKMSGQAQTPIHRRRRRKSESVRKGSAHFKDRGGDTEALGSKVPVQADIEVPKQHLACVQCRKIHVPDLKLWGVSHEGSLLVGLAVVVLDKMAQRGHCSVAVVLPLHLRVTNRGVEPGAEASPPREDRVAVHYLAEKEK